MEQIEINVNKTVEEVEINVQPNITQVIINEVSGGRGVESVTGNIVDNTDPLNPVVDFNAGNYDLEDFTNEGANPFAKISDIPAPVDQDNIPTPVTLYLSDLGLTEFGTDAEMQTALQSYFTANPQAVGEKEIFDFIIEEAAPVLEPYLRLEFDDISLFASDYGITDLNDVSDWNAAFSSDFTNVEISGNVAELTGATIGVFFIANALETWDLIDFDLGNLTGNCTVNISDSSYTLDAIKINNCPAISEIRFNPAPENITVLPATISNMHDLIALEVVFGIGGGIETIELGALNGCTSLDFIDLAPANPNNLTAAQLDNIANWAENDAPNNGTLNLATSEDISGSATIGFLTGKGWTVNV
jgi:hypothetical protein